jgi:type VI protein secretion system component Hcp
MKRFGLAVRVVLLGSVALLPVARAMAATAAKMTIGEPAQGNVKGSKAAKGGSPVTVIELLSVTRPGTDAASGSAAGKRSSSGADTLIVTKYYDSNSAQLEQAAATNQVLREVTIAFETAAAANGATSNSKVKGNANRTAASGAAASTSKAAQVLVLKNVQVDEIEQTRNLQKITIEYQSIEVTYASGKPATASDDWETP